MRSSTQVIDIDIISNRNPYSMKVTFPLQTQWKSYWTLIPNTLL